VIEPSAAAAVTEVADNSKTWCDLRGKSFVVLGAGSQMGPTAVLLAMGATVIAVDLPRPQLWEKLFKLAERSPGRLLYPKGFVRYNDGVSYGTAEPGCDLLTQTIPIAQWIAEQTPSERLVLGSYCYLDGALFTRIVMVRPRL
jgi:hypothetical protein